MVLEELFRRPSALARFRRPPLGPELDGFCSWLQRQGFSRGCLRTRVWQASHFNQVLRAGGVTACAQVQRADAERFLSEHLPRCRCRDGVGYSPAGTPSAIRSLLDYLSQRGLVACPPSPCAPQPPVLEQYLDYFEVRAQPEREHRQGPSCPSHPVPRAARCATDGALSRAVAATAARLLHPVPRGPMAFA